MRARFIVRGGARWTIGSGASISILNEPWLTNGEFISSDVPGAHFLHNFTINILMNLYDKSWNEQVVRQVFSVDIASKILHTPLISQVEEDRIVWKGERHGHYSVRSAYRLCVTELIDSSYLWHPGYWSGIWNLKVPPKVKNLLWRMCRGCLPTHVRLLDKGVVCPTTCASCDSSHEDLSHVFFECPFTIQVWHTTGLWGSVQHALSQTASTTEAIFYLLENLAVELSQRLSTVMWSIWKHRNLRVWDNVTETSDVVVERARNMVTDWQLANAPNILAVVSPPPPGTAANVGTSAHDHHAGSLWQPPMPGRYKCNVDTAFSSHHNRTGIGVCVRDSEGTFVLAKTFTYPCIVSVDVGEALVLHSALQWLSDMQLENVDFETDSKLIVDAFRSDRTDLSEFACIISSCRSLFHNLFSNSRVEFVRRQANGVAHTLAREVTRSAVYYDIPACIKPIIINEML